MVKKTIVLNSDSGIRIGGLTDQIDPTSKTAVSTATVTGRLYDRRKIKQLTLDTDGDGVTPTILKLTNANVFIVGEAIELLLDNGIKHTTTISAVNGPDETVTMAGAVPGGRIALANSFVKRKLGPDISMVLYGATPAPGVDTWGYRGSVADTHEGLYLKQKVRVEVTADDGAGRRHVFTWNATVVAG